MPPRYSHAPTTPYGSRNTTTPKSGKKQTNFSFPILDVKDILCCIEEFPFSMAISEADILSCEKNVSTIRRLFENLLESLGGIRKEEITQPVFAAYEKLNFPQLHEDSIAELAFWRQLSRLMEVCGISDFTREDLYRPEPKRLKRQLSALINFGKFREERINEYDEITSKRDEQLARLHALQAQTASKRAELEALRENNKVQREEMKQVSEATAVKLDEIATRDAEQSALRHVSQSLKQENMDLKEKLGSLEMELGSCTSEMKKLQGQVVQSPERVRREMLESQRALACERREGEASEAAALQAMAAAKAVSDAVTKVTEAANNASELLGLSEKCVEIGKTIKTREVTLKGNKKESEEVLGRCEEIDRRTHRIVEKLKHLEAHSESKAEVAGRENEELRSYLLDQRRKKTIESAAYSEDTRDCDEIVVAIEQEESRHKKSVNDLFIAFKRLEQTVLSQQQDIINEAQSTFSVPQSEGEFGGYDAYCASTPVHVRGHETPLMMRGAPSPFQSAHFARPTYGEGVPSS